MATIAAPRKSALRRELETIVGAGGVLSDPEELLVYESDGLTLFRALADAQRKIGELAEAEGHHPDLYLAWGKCKVEIWTHKINGLTESDFYMAAKADRAFEPFKATSS